MLGYFDELQERFFTWCDDAAKNCMEHSGAVLRQWWPRKNPEGGYELVLELAAGDRAPFKQNVSIPGEFHALLEREYFIDHPPDKDE